MKKTRKEGVGHNFLPMGEKISILNFFHFKMKSAGQFIRHRFLTSEREHLHHSYE